jgi:hypothetical protein
MQQQFKKGDHVRIAKDLGSMMDHFTNDKDAIVIGSYDDQYGGGDTSSYTIYIEGEGETSWYEEHQLTLIEKNRPDLIIAWRDAASIKRKLYSDMDWIFTHPDEAMNGVSLARLGKDLGIKDMWGSRGEGIDLFNNQQAVWNMAEDFIIHNDRKGWDKLIEDWIDAN